MDSGASIGDGSSSDSDEAYEEYLGVLGGAEERDTDAADATGERARRFFVELHHRPSGADGEARGTSAVSLAERLARSLAHEDRAAARAQQRRRDARELLERVASEFERGLTADEAEEWDERLRTFARAAAADEDMDAETIGEAEAGVASATPDTVAALQTELLTLRRTMVAGFVELKSAINDLKPAHKPS